MLRVEKLETARLVAQLYTRQKLNLCTLQLEHCSVEDWCTLYTEVHMYEYTCTQV